MSITWSKLRKKNSLFLESIYWAREFFCSYLSVKINTLYSDPSNMAVHSQPGCAAWLGVCGCVWAGPGAAADGSPARHRRHAPLPHHRPGTGTGQSCGVLAFRWWSKLTVHMTVYNNLCFHLLFGWIINLSYCNMHFINFTWFFSIYC